MGIFVEIAAMGVLALGTLVLLAAALEAAGRWHIGPVLKQIKALGLAPADEQAAIQSLRAARRAELGTVAYDVTAPIVMLLVLPFVPRAANKLPAFWRKWDNNISINGDSGGVQLPDGRWVEDYEVADWAAVQGCLHVTYDDPRYGGHAYYAKGHHPRSFWARYVWLGWRNRAVQASMDRALRIDEPEHLVAGDAATSQRHPGVCLKRAGGAWLFLGIEPLGPFVIRRHYGWKVYDAPGPCRPVAIGWSLQKGGATD